MTLKEHTVKSYDKDLQAIEETINQMSLLVLESIDIVAKAVIDHDAKHLETIIEHDYKINSLDYEIEKKMTSMLALRQPMAVDLRYIVSSLKVAANLERIGDQAKGIIKKIIRVKFSVVDDENVEQVFLQMINLTKKMVAESIVAFNTQDISLADEVLLQDDEVDQLYKNFFNITNKNEFDHDQLENIINILFIAKSFERLADHSTNIAEIAKYVVTGEKKDEN